MKVFNIFLAMFAVSLLYAGFASAQDVVTVPDTHINVGQLLAPWAEMLMSAVAILITAILGWIATQIKAKTGIDIEARHREALQTALINGTGLILSKLTGELDKVVIDVKHPLVAAGVRYVMSAVPDAVEKFGLTPEQIAQKLVAKLGLATVPSSAATTPAIAS